MHSSRMRTVRCSCHLGMGVAAQEVSTQEGVCPGGCLPGGCLPCLGVSAPVHAGIHNPLWIEFLTHACNCCCGR